MWFQILKSKTLSLLSWLNVRLRCWIVVLIEGSRIQNENLAKDLQRPFFLGLFVICNVAILPLICKVFEKTKIYFYWDWQDEKLANSSILLLSWFQKWGSFGEMQSQLVCFHISQCLKITKKVSINIASEASYVYILSGQKFIH